MAQKVEILVTAKDAASQVMRGIASNFGEIGNAVQNLTSGAGLEYLTSQIIAFGKESVNATVAYADEVRKLSQITGESAEETSRLIQLSDDYKISVSDLTLASKTLAKDGIALTTDSLARLSDEYLRLEPGQERAAFLMENFGRAGYRMAELLQQGGAAIRQMGEDIDDSLVLTEDAVQAAREYEMAMDSLGEQTLKLQYALGNKLIPTITHTVKAFNTAIDEADKKSETSKFLTGYGVELITELFKKAPAPIDSATQSYMAMAQTLQGQVVPALEQVEIDTKAIDQANQNLLSTITTIAGEELNYTSQIKQVESDRAKVTEELAQARAQGWSEQSAKVQDLIGRLGELDKKEAEITNSVKTNAAERILARVQEKLSVDGITDAEADYILEVGKNLGVYTQKHVDQARNEIKKAEDLAKGFEDYQNRITNAEAEKFATSGEQWRLYTENVGNQLDTNIGAIQDYINALNDIPADVNTTISVTLPSGDLAAGQTSTQSGQTVNYYIQNAYIDSANGIQQVI